MSDSTLFGTLVGGLIAFYTIWMTLRIILIERGYDTVIKSLRDRILEYYTTIGKDIGGVLAKALTKNGQITINKENAKDTINILLKDNVEVAEFITKSAINISAFESQKTKTESYKNMNRVFGMYVDIAGLCFVLFTGYLLFLSIIDNILGYIILVSLGFTIISITTFIYQLRKLEKSKVSADQSKT